MKTRETNNNENQRNCKKVFQFFLFVWAQTTTLNVQDNTVLKDANTHQGVGEQKWRSRSNKVCGTNRILVQTEEKVLLIWDYR